MVVRRSDLRRQLHQEAEELDEKKLAEALQQAKKKQILGRGFYRKMGKIDEHLGVFEIF